MEASAQFFCTALPLFSVSLLSLFFVPFLNDRDIKILKLLRIYRCRSFHHKTGRVFYLREGNYVTDAVCTYHKHNDTVEAVCETSVRRYSVLERVKQEAELLSCSLFCEAKNFEHLLLDIILVDTDGSAAELGTV
jgi:hypothetical protein